MQPITTENLSAIRELCRQHHVRSLYAFGSATRQDFSAQSDVDFLYELDYTGWNLDDASTYTYDPLDAYFDLKWSLEKLLHREVDLVLNREFSNPFFREGMERDKQLIYDKAA